MFSSLKGKMWVDCLPWLAILMNSVKHYLKSRYQCMGQHSVCFWKPLVYMMAEKPQNLSNRLLLIFLPLWSKIGKTQSQNNLSAEMSVYKSIRLYCFNKTAVAPWHATAWTCRTVHSLRMGSGLVANWIFQRCDLTPSLLCIFLHIQDVSIRKMYCFWCLLFVFQWVDPSPARGCFVSVDL